MEMDLSVHTMCIHRLISGMEAGHICQLYGKTFSKDVLIDGSDIKTAGINQIEIKGTRIPASGKWVYDIRIRVNVGRLVGKTRAAMLVMDQANSEAVIKKLDRYFINVLHLKPKHCMASEWYLSRLDCGIDIRLCTDAGLCTDAKLCADYGILLQSYMKALHDSFDSANCRGVQYSKYLGYDAPEVKRESVTLQTSGYGSGSPGYRYNIYYKLLQILKHSRKAGMPPSQEEIAEIWDVIRIEKQIDNVSKVLGKGSLGQLLDGAVRDKVMGGIVREVRLLFGAGDYLPYDQAVREIYSSPCDIRSQNRMGSVYAYVSLHGYPALLDYLSQEITAMGGTEEDVARMKKEVNMARKSLEKMGISVASIEGEQPMKGIVTLLEEESVKRRRQRKKGRFCNIRPCQERSGGIRFKCNPTLHHADGTTFRRSLSGKVGGTREECEMVVFEAIRSNLNENYFSLVGRPGEQMECCVYAREELMGLLTVAADASVREDIRQMIGKIDRRIIKKKMEAFNNDKGQDGRKKEQEIIHKSIEREVQV